MDLGCGHGSDSEWSMGVKGERKREVLSLEKLNNFFKDVYVILMCCNVKIECLM